MLHSCLSSSHSRPCTPSPIASPIRCGGRGLAILGPPDAAMLLPVSMMTATNVHVPPIKRADPYFTHPDVATRATDRMESQWQRRPVFRIREGAVPSPFSPSGITVTRLYFTPQRGPTLASHVLMSIRRMQPLTIRSGRQVRRTCASHRRWGADPYFIQADHHV